MDIFDRNSITKFDDFVFEDDAKKKKVLHRASVTGATNTLFHGDAGTGKSTLCRLISSQLVGANFLCDITVINVSNCAGKKEVTDKIVAQNGFYRFNNLSKLVVVLEELDGATSATQKALKHVITENSETILFLATVNEINKIIKPVLDRFECISLNPAPPEKWKTRATQVLANEKVKFSENQVKQFLELQANCVSGRQIMRALDTFAHSVKLANTGRGKLA